MPKQLDKDEIKMKKKILPYSFVVDFDRSPEFTDEGISWFYKQGSYTVCRNYLPANRKTYSTLLNNSVSIVVLHLACQ